VSDIKPSIVVYGKDNCPYCVAAENFLKTQGLEYSYFEARHDEANRDKMLSLAKGKTYPQIIINGTAIGGFSDMMELHQSGELDTLLNKP
jgi:glutaredoxin 3